MNNDSRTYNSFSNMTMSFIQKFVSILLTFIGRQIFLQVLSIEYLGINRLFGDIISMLSLADLGIATAMAYSFYKPLAEKDEDKLAALIGFYRTVYNIIAVVVTVIGVALTPFLKYIINIETEIPHIEVYYLLTLSHTVISYLFVYKSTIISADQQSRVVRKFSIYISIVIMAVQIVVLLTVKSYMIYCIVPVFGTLANNLIISQKADKMYPFIKKKIQLAAIEKRDIFSNIRSMFIYKIATITYGSTNSIVMSTIIGTAIVGQYSNYRLAVLNLSNIASMAFTSLTPSIGNLIVKENTDKSLRIFKLMQMLSYWISGFFIFCLFFLLDDFVRLWIGAEYVFDMPTKLAVLINFYLTITLTPIFAFREATGIYQKTKYIMLSGAIINVILSIILGIYYGLPGILIATSISKILTYAWYEPKVLFRDYLGGRAVSYLYGHIINFMMLTIFIAIAHFAFPLAESSNWIEWIIKGVICSIIINVVYFLKYFKVPEFQEIIRKVKGLRK